MQFVGIAQEELKPLVIIPFLELTELISHEIEFFPGMRHHISEEGAHARELFLVSTRHLVDERALPVHDFIVRDGQNVVLGECVHHREGKFAVVVHAEIRVEAQIGEHIVHPSHIPLEIESQSADGTGFCDQPPRGGLLCDHQRIREPEEDRLVEFPQEGDRFEVLVLAVNIRHPLPVALIVIEIEHGRNGVYAETVHMVFIEEEAGV